MGKLIGLIKELFLDAFASTKGLVYGFFVTALVIVAIGAAIYMVLLLRNLIVCQQKKYPVMHRVLFVYLS